MLGIFYKIRLQNPPLPFSSSGLVYYSVRKLSSSRAASFNTKKVFEESPEEVAEKGSGQQLETFCSGGSSLFPPFPSPSLNSPGRIKPRAGLWPILQYMRSVQVTDTSEEMRS